jgi:DNA replication protein DnaC
MDIDLTLEETEEALRLARKNKFYILKRLAYQESLTSKEVYQTKTAEQLFEDFKATGMQLQTPEHEKTVKNLCCFFAKDPRFKGNLSKGILFMGKQGTGKSELMRFFQANQNFSFRLDAMLDIQFDYKMSGEEGVKPYNTNFRTAPNQFGLSDYGYCFDDLGTEEVPARHFAESKNIFSEIIQVRYHNQLPFNSTHAITNKNESDLKELYGTRAYDRMKEMFNVIIFTHESFR